MLEEKIKLNFYPLVTQQFEFKVWRKPYNIELKSTIQNLHRNTLPIDYHSTEKRSEYWISFEPIEGFEEFTCKQDFNNPLTLGYLHYATAKKTSDTLSNNEYVPEDGFRKRVFFILREHVSGKESIWIEPFFLSPAHKFGFLMDFKFIKNPAVPFSRDIQRLSLSLDNAFRSNRNFYIDRFQKILEFSKFRERIFPMLSNTGIELNISNNLEELPVQSLNSKKYTFGNEGTDSSQFKGISSFGPLEHISSQVLFAYIYKNSDKDYVNDLKSALRGDSYGVAFKGLQKVFGLKVEAEYDIIISDVLKVNLEHAVSEIIRIKSENKDALVLPIFIEDENDENAYYTMKYLFLKQRIPLQVVTVQLLKKREQFKWAASNIALQIFAKLGGKPWKVVPAYSKSIIFGIGQSHQEEDDKIVKYFAYSVCTDSSGIYKKINVLGRSTDKQTYLEQLKNNMILTIKEHMGGEYTQCVLHIPFKIKMEELASISEAINSLSGIANSMNFIVLRINVHNKFFGYANTNSLIPYEGSYILINNKPKSYLVWFEGLQRLGESVYKRMPGPVHIEFYWNSKILSNEERLNYLQDVLNLSGANWRGFNATSLPVSIYYCELITEFLKKFPQEIDVMEQLMVPWFI